MADGVPITAGAGTLVATDDLTGDGSVGGHVQLVKLLDGTDGGNTRVAGSTRGLNVEPRAKVVRVTVQPAISTAIYAAKDNVGARLDFASAVRANGATGTILSAQIVDKAQQRAALELVLFRASFTAPTDNAIFAPTDTEMLDCVGVIPFFSGDWFDFSTNSVAHKSNLGLTFDAAATTLYGALVARGTPTYVATTDLQVTLEILQD